MNNLNSKASSKLIPIMLTFFTMGFVDMVGIATNYIKADFALSDTIANGLTSMVFVWFLICSVPTSALMNKIGQRRTVLLSLAVTFASLLLPLIHYSLASMTIAFTLLGIGNVLMQVSLNPLLSNLVSEKKLASTMTFGQFIKAIASLLAPVLAAKMALIFGDWKMLYLLFLAINLLSALWLWFTKIEEPQKEGSQRVSIISTFKMLGDKQLFLLFIGLMCHVVIDVGTNVSAPKILMEKLGVGLSQAGIATSIYFLFRVSGCILGSSILSKCSHKVFFYLSVSCISLGVLGLYIFGSMVPLYACFALIGFGNSNIYPMIFSKALLSRPQQKNATSGLMTMGVFGGTVFPFLMGVTSDALHSQVGVVLVLSACVLYLWSMVIKRRSVI
ncbi:MAG: sugar MFS transporter [Bacteroidales bacterium]|nr:sugar MFS transporter [Bacteroidales bacterium]